MKKGQVVVIGFILTVVLFILVISLFYSQFNSIFADESDYPDIKGDSEHVSNLLLTEGYPPDWETDTVMKLGILDGDVISLRKLENFSKIPYYRSKLLLGVKYDYMFLLERTDSSVIMIPNVNRDFLGWNGDVQSYPGNGGRPFEFFFDAITSKAEHIARNEKFVEIDEGIGEYTYGKLIVYTWDAVNDLMFNETQCNNGIDDDGDGYVDLDDPGCLDLNDDNETDPPLNLSCDFKSTNCDTNETEIIEFYGAGSFFPFPGNDIYHAALSGSGYSNKVCCYYGPFIEVSTEPDCGGADGYEVLVRLDKEVNAHVQDNSYSDYANKTCIRGTVQPIDCTYEFNPLSDVCLDTDRECLFSMSDSTNAHIGDCLKFDIKVCCKFV